MLVLIRWEKKIKEDKMTTHDKWPKNKQNNLPKKMEDYHWTFPSQAFLQTLIIYSKLKEKCARFSSHSKERFSYHKRNNKKNEDTLECNAQANQMPKIETVE